jgi:hypothetical protein
LYNLMQGVNITDPLELEEKILDLQYRNRHLEKELRVLKQQGNQSLANKKKIKELSKKILSLEGEDEAAKEQERQKREQLNLESELQKAILAKDRVQQDYHRLLREKDQCTEEYSMRLEQIQQELKILEKKHDDVRQYILSMKSERDEVKTKLFRAQVKFNNTQKYSVKLDREIEEVFGRAVNNNDLGKLYELDMAQLSKISQGSGPRVQGVIRNMAASRIQAAFRAKKVRFLYVVERFRRDNAAKKLGKAYKAKTESRKLAAAVMIQALFRRKKRSELKHKELLQKQSAEGLVKTKLAEADLEKRKENAARRIFYIWKWHKVLRTWAAKKAAGALHDSGYLSGDSAKTSGVHYLDAETDCGVCKSAGQSAVATRYCAQCADGPHRVFCDSCFKKHHNTGARSRHERMTIEYRSLKKKQYY